MTEDAETKPGPTPSSLRPEEVARLLSNVGGRVLTVDMVQSDVADGAPTNPDGTINLLHYGAWLVREMT